MIETKKYGYLFLVLSVCLMPFCPLKAQSQPVSKVGVAIVSTIATSCALATFFGASVSYKEFKEWRKASTEFQEDYKVLEDMGAKIDESIAVRAFGNQEIREHSIKVTPGKQFSPEQKRLFTKYSKSLINLFERKEEARKNHIGMSAFTLVMGLVSSALIKVILDNTLLARA